MSDYNPVLEKISRREAERQEKLIKAHKNKEELPTDENEEFFAGTFKNKLEFIEDLLTKIPSIEKHSMTEHFELLKKDINDLQKYVITSSLFLKEFNMKKYLSIVQNLQTKCYELEEIYNPHKKFGFSKKKIMCKVSSPKEKSDHIDGPMKQPDNKWSENLFGFESRENELLELDSNEIYQRDVSMTDLRDCTVILKGVMGTLHLTNLTNTVILSGPVCTSVFIQKCTNCKIVVACQQLRMHSSIDCDIYLHVTCKGIVEDCKGIRTAPYNYKYDNLENQYKMSGLDANVNNWDTLDDFNWLAPDVPSPNWSILDTEQRITNWDKYISKTTYK